MDVELSRIVRLIRQANPTSIKGWFETIRLTQGCDWWNKQKNVWLLLVDWATAWSVGFFVSLPTQKNKIGNADANEQEQQGGFCLFYADATLALLRFWWLLSLAISMASSDQKAQASSWLFSIYKKH